MAPDFTLLKYDVVGDGSAVSLDATETAGSDESTVSPEAIGTSFGDGSRDTEVQASLKDSLGFPETASGSSGLLGGSHASLKAFDSDESGLLDAHTSLKGFNSDESGLLDGSQTAGGSSGLLDGSPAMANVSPETADTLLLASIPASVHSVRSTFLP